VAIIVNEFVIHGVSGARISVLLGGFALLVASRFIPTLIYSVSSYAASNQNDDIGRHLQASFFDVMRLLDIGTIEQPEFQNIVEISNSRGWNHFFTIIFHINSFAKNFALLIFSAVALIGISPLVLIILTVGALPGYFIERRNGIILNDFNKASSEASRTWGAKSRLIEEKDQLIEMKNFDTVKVFKGKFLSLIGSFHEKKRDIMLSYRKNDIAGEVILMTAFGISFFILIHRVYLGALSIGSLVFCFSVVQSFQGSISDIFDSFGKISEYKKNVSLVMDMIEMKPLVISGDLIIEPEDFQSLEVQNVSFSYHGSEKYILKNISLTFAKGQNIAIVGLNGAGKTTLIKLLTRVYDPTSGQILVNGIDLRQYDLESWKRCLGILMQEYSTYAEETIAENIMLGDVSKHELGLVEQAAKDSTAHGFIVDLPDGYEQKVGTEFRGGVELSKGQKQKLAIARVFYRSAPVIILDEPTAAIDALSEDAIFKALRQNHNNQTRIIISHKFSNVRDADQIILIEHGSIIEQGSHDDLMKLKNGKYKELFELQAEGYK
jgi:ATP-binding cassette subfamily B protein